ncbi:MAG: YcxB family protein [Asgard group archaeon]|nr:YcxB family protein [Asgard group archaeon]
MTENTEVMTSYKSKYSDMKTAYIEYLLTSKRKIAQFVIIGILFLICVTLIILFQTIIFLDIFANLLVVLLGIFFLYLLLKPLLTIRRLESVWHSTMRIPKEYTWVISSEHIVLTRKYGQFILPWNYFIGIIEQKSSFCFYISSADYYVLPKRALTSEHISLLRQLILASVNPLLVRVKIKNRF